MSVVPIPAPAPYAGSTVPGIVSTGAQTFGGVKTFAAQIVASGGVKYADNSTQTSAGISQSSGDTRYLQLSGGTLTGSIHVGALIESTSGGFKFPDATIQTSAGISQSVGDARYLQLSGGTLTGSIHVGALIESTSGGFKFPDGSIQTTAATSGGGWIKAVDFKFSNQNTQLLATDGSYTLTPSNVTIVKRQSAGDASPMSVTHGTGLVITPVQSTVYANSGKSAAAVVFNLSTLIPNFDLDTPIRITVRMASNNPAGNYDSTVMAVEFAGKNTEKYIMTQEDSGTNKFYLVSDRAGSQQSYFFYGAYPGTDVWQITYNSGCQTEAAAAKIGTYSSGLPSNGTLAPFALTDDWSNLTNGYALDTAATVQLVLTAYRNGSGNAFVSVFDDVRIEYKL